jgi:hypothetical protein
MVVSTGKAIAMINKDNKRHFKFVIKMQLAWLILAILFHVVSLIRVWMGLAPLSAAPPMMSILSLCIIYFPLLYLGWKSYLVIYGLINGFVFGLMLFTGQIPRVMMYFSPEGISAYPSAVGWFGGILINGIGIPLGFYGSWLALSLAWGRKCKHPVERKRAKASADNRAGTWS